MPRSRSANKELVWNVLVGGRVIAAFRRHEHAIAFAIVMREEYPDRLVELNQ